MGIILVKSFQWYAYYTTRNLEGIYESPEENGENDQSDANNHESPSHDEEARPIHRRSVQIDIEEGRLNLDGPGHFDGRYYTGYFLATTCGFLASLISLSIGMTFVFKCPVNSLLPLLFIFMGTTGTFPMLYIIYKLLRKRFDGFRSYESAPIELCGIFLFMLWLISLLIISQTDLQDSTIIYCKREFYTFAVMANAISFSAIVYHFLLQDRNRNKEE